MNVNTVLVQEERNQEELETMDSLRNFLVSFGILHKSGAFRDWRPLAGPISVLSLAGGAYALHHDALTQSTLGVATANIVVLASAYVAMLRSSCADVPKRTAPIRPCYRCDPPRAVTDAARTHHCWECGAPGSLVLGTSGLCFPLPTLCLSH